MTGKQAKKIIMDLLDAGNNGALVQCQDGGNNVDIVFSKRKGHESEVMTLKESERLTNKAIRKAYKALTGFDVVGDPVDFINR